MKAKTASKLMTTGFAAVAVLAVCAPPATAGVIIAGIEVPTGAVFKSSTIWEETVQNPGDVLSGVGRINTIEDNSGNIVWQDGDNGRELTFVFGSYVTERITISGDTAEIKFSGGDADFFSDSSPDLDVSDTSATAFSTAGDGTEWLNLLGSTTGNTTVAGDHSGAGVPITLEATLNISGGDLTAIDTGSGSGFLSVDITGLGLANPNFDTDAFGSGRDFVLNSNFNTVNASPAFPVRGTADFQAQFVPVPATAILLGAGLLLLGATSRLANI